MLNHHHTRRMIVDKVGFCFKLYALYYIGCRLKAYITFRTVEECLEGFTDYINQKVRGINPRRVGFGLYSSQTNGLFNRQIDRLSYINRCWRLHIKFNRKI